MKQYNNTLLAHLLLLKYLQLAHGKLWSKLGKSLGTLLANSIATIWLCSSCHAAVFDNGDPLQFAAEPNIRASQSMLLGITRAGARLVAVGERGLIIYSDDNGRTWTQAKVPVGVAITNVNFPTASLGWAVGHSGVILHTKDGGMNWETQLTGISAAELELSAARLAPQSDRNWAKRLSDAERLRREGADKPFLDVRFWTSTNGIAIGAYGLAVATDDGGVHWKSIMGSIDNPNGKHLYSIIIVNNTIYLAGEQGALYRSPVNQLQFAALKTPYHGTYFGLLANDPDSLIVFGLKGNVYRSRDRGMTWSRVQVGFPNTLTAGATLADGTVALVDSAGGFLISRNGGNDFDFVSLSNPTSFTGLVEASDGTLVLSGARGIALVQRQSIRREQRK